MSELAKAVCAVMTDVRYVPETGVNPHQGYKYASDEDLLVVVQPSMARHGLVLIPTAIQQQVVDHAQTAKGKAQYRTELVVTYTLLHTSGEERQVQVPGCGVDTEDKGPYKAMTGALKYALRHLFLVPTGQDPERVARGEDDKPPDPKGKPRQAKPEPVSSGPSQEAIQALVQAGWSLATVVEDIRDFAAWCGITGDPWSVPVARQAKLPKWAADNADPFRVWSAWWKEVDGLLRVAGLEREDLRSYVATLDPKRPEPERMDHEQRGKLLDYLKNAGGLDRVQQHRRRAA